MYEFWQSFRHRRLVSQHRIPPCTQACFLATLRDGTTQPLKLCFSLFFARAEARYVETGEWNRWKYCQGESHIIIEYVYAQTTPHDAINSSEAEEPHSYRLI